MNNALRKPSKSLGIINLKVHHKGMKKPFIRRFNKLIFAGLIGSLSVGESITYAGCGYFTMVACRKYMRENYGYYYQDQAISETHREITRVRKPQM